jgi:hypothetical protein
MRDRVHRSLEANPERTVADRLSKLDSDLHALEATPRGERGLSFGSLEGQFNSIMGSSDEFDSEPRRTVQDAFKSATEQLSGLMDAWDKLKTTKF